MRIHAASVVLGAIGGALAISVVSFTSFGTRPIEAQADALLASQKAQVMVAAYQMDNSGLHDLDVKMNNGEFVPGALGRVRKARIATQSTMWPADLQSDANELVGRMTQLESALRDENVPAAAPLAKDVHEMYHGLSDKSYAWLSGAAPGSGH